jgi:hypothetical protein
MFGASAVKRNITLSIDKELLRQARGMAAKRGMSISALLSEKLLESADHERAYERAKSNALAQMDLGFHLGGTGIRDRAALHDRGNLR